MNNQELTIEDVSEAFATEFASNPNALKKFLMKYPQFSIELVDLSRGLSHMAVLEDDPSRDDETFLSASLQRFKTTQVQTNNLQSAPDNLFKTVAKKFKIPYLILLSIRERRIEPSTISDHFLKLFSRALGTTPLDLQSFLSQPINVTVRANKSDQKPAVPSKVAFEQILNDAQISSEKLAELLEKGQ